MAALLSFQNGRLQVVHEFGTVVEDSCASGLPGSCLESVGALHFRRRSRQHAKAHDGELRGQL